MRFNLVSPLVAVAALATCQPYAAAAAPVTTAAALNTSPVVTNSIENIYYYHGRYYPYHYRGGYYSYRYGGQYYRHRYYRSGRWHYY